MDAMRLNRRAFLGSASVVALCGPVARAAASVGRIAPAPLSSVRLLPSRWKEAVELNRKTLASYDPERLLHNFYRSAGLAAPKPLYGGWEARGIAGHTLGHYMTALALTWAQTGDMAARERLGLIVGELARIQRAHGDGYVGGTTVERDGRTVDGKIVFEEMRRGEIRTSGFDVNGGWVPLYTWHKVHAGLIDAVELGGIAAARPVLLGMAGYLGTILEGLDEAKLQLLLNAEHGGLNESYADTHALTGDPRWLRLAERIRHRRVLDPLAAGQDRLEGLHANTQIPKVLGLARLHELTGDPGHAAAARFFRTTVVRDHSYAIGGNSEREHFGPPRALAGRVTERTCEACNSYNMLKLTRRLWSWAPDGALFDDYERTHLNHILGHQHPETGMFNYFMPLSAGAKRLWSTHDASFWCCMGSGMESHAKHGDSIWWGEAGTLWVNLFIPSELDWAEAGWKARLETRYPFAGTVDVTLAAVPAGTATVALRAPGWCAAPTLLLNGRAAGAVREGGYLRLTRRWRAGDRLQLRVPMVLRAEPIPGDPRTIAYVNGPVVLAADLGPAAEPFDALAPALVGTDPAAAVEPIDAAEHRFRLAAHPAPVTLAPFFAQYDRRTAVYFPSFTAGQWAREGAAFETAQREAAALAARTVDVVQLGEQQPEQDHGFAANHSDLFSFAGRTARQIPWGTGNWLEVTMAVRAGPMALRVLYWGEETGKKFDISVDGVTIASERRDVPPEKRFVAIEYALPPALVDGKRRIRVRFETRGTDAFVYEVRTIGA
jgi:DUF1680 family protein